MRIKNQLKKTNNTASDPNQLISDESEPNTNQNSKSGKLIDMNGQIEVPKEIEEEEKTFDQTKNLQGKKDEATIEEEFEFINSYNEEFEEKKGEEEYP